VYGFGRMPLLAAIWIWICQLAATKKTPWLSQNVTGFAGRERSGGAISLSGPWMGGRRHDNRDERVRDRRVAADGIRRHREVSPLPGDALITRSGVDARPGVSGSVLLRLGGAAAGTWKAGSCRARLAQREKSLGWLTLGSVHAESG
jgi:hypothetical protein